MYAIIKSGGKQYKVEKGNIIRVEKLDVEQGKEVTFDVLMTVNGKTVKVGDPLVKDVVVKGKVLEHGKAKKIIVFKYKKKKDYRKKQGHRQPYTNVEITAVGKDGDGKDTAEAKKADDVKVTAEDKPKKTAAKAVEKKPEAEKKATKKTEAKPAAKATAAKKAEDDKKAPVKKAPAKKAPAKKADSTKTEKKDSPAKKTVKKDNEADK